MYALYRKTRTADGLGDRYQLLQGNDIHLFGCTHGRIPLLLKQSLAVTANEPIKWRVSIESGMRDAGCPDHTLVIDLKPKRPNKPETNLSLYEVVEVWGHSSQGWTPIMLHLKGLFIDEDPKVANREDFTRSAEQVDDPIFSMMYLHGTVVDGSLVGKWTTPRPGATNSVLLWPESLKYFYREAARLMQGPVSTESRIP
jgi:hypothetical protein